MFKILRSLPPEVDHVVFVHIINAGCDSVQDLMPSGRKFIFSFPGHSSQSGSAGVIAGES